MTDTTKALSSAQLQLGDIVIDCDDLTSRQCVVKQIKDGWLTMFSPYIHRGDIGTTAGISVYTGFSEFDIKADDTRNGWVLIDRIKLRTKFR